MSKMKPEIAKRRIESFEKRFGKAHLYLAYHAAFPLSLTPDLLYRLWANFQRDIHGEVLGIPWIAVADLLLSSLFNEVGHELYEMDLAVRNELLSRLKEDEKFAQQRINELSDFLLEYVRQQLQSDDPDIRDFAQVQQWTALAYTQPNEAARELALAFSKLDHKDTTELVRMASLAETFAEPLAEFQPLLIYARGMEKFARGNLKDAIDRLREVPKKGNVIQVAGVDLPIPEQLQTNITTSVPFITKLFWLIPWFNLLKFLGASIGVTALVVLMRVSGLLEASELLFFDQMMRYQPTEEQDSNLLLVEITSDDIKHYSSDKQKYGIAQNGASLPDKVIFELLNSLIEKKPRVIGIDIYRNFSAYDENLIKLFRDKEKSKLLIFVCKFPDTLKNNDEGYDPPPDVLITQVGLSDLLDDSDGVIRRQLLTMGTPETRNSKCRNKERKEMESFSFKVAQKYLATDKNLKPYSKLNENGFFKSGNTVLQPLDTLTHGGYNLKNDSFNGYQILLNYRFVRDGGKVSPDYLAQRISVRTILDGNIDDDLVKEKIVLIGTPIDSFDSAHATPFSSSTTGGEKMRGLYLQAQMVSQLVSAALYERPLLKVWQIQYDMLWILFWSLVGGFLALFIRQPIKLIVSGGVVFISLYVVCLIFFTTPIKFWIPFVPPALSLLGTGVVIVFIRFKA
jgi:CHASE2 domain-containing sensor protein